MRSSACSPNIPTLPSPSMARCQEWVRRNPADASLEKLVRIDQCFPVHKRCNAWQERLPELSIRPDSQAPSSPPRQKVSAPCRSPLGRLKSLAGSSWAQAYYQQQRSRDGSHACVIRALGQRWLKILWKMWESNTSYDPDFHNKNHSNILGSSSFLRQPPTHHVQPAAT